MASFTARSVAFVMRKTGLFRRLPTDMPDFASFHGKQLCASSAPSAKNRRACQVTQRLFQGCTVWTMAPKVSASRVHVLFWHGGAYLYPPTSVHWDFLARMVSVFGWQVTVPLYPLAPAANVQRVTAFALDFMREWMARPTTGIRVIAGDSAGAGLAAATMLTARDIGLAMPDKALLICPWLDIAMDHPDQAHIELRDAILTRQGLRAAGAMYTGTVGVQDARASPLHSDWTGLPPLLVFGGGDDILVTDARQLQTKVPDAIYCERAGMIHDWPLLFFPESRDAQACMAAFSRQEHSSIDQQM